MWQKLTLVYYLFCYGRPDNVKISMDTFVKRFQPEKYELWLQGKDFGPHPEDPNRVSAAPAPSENDIMCNKKFVTFLITTVITLNPPQKICNATGF